MKIELDTKKLTSLPEHIKFLFYIPSVSFFLGAAIRYYYRESYDYFAFFIACFVGYLLWLLAMVMKNANPEY